MHTPVFRAELTIQWGRGRGPAAWWVRTLQHQSGYATAVRECL